MLSNDLTFKSHGNVAFDVFNKVPVLYFPLALLLMRIIRD